MAVRSFYGLKRPRASTADENEEEATSNTPGLTPDPTSPCPVDSMTLPGSSRHNKRRLLHPEPVYKVFPRQKMALEFALNCYQSVGIFAFESEKFGREGQRRYIATTYYEFGRRYLDEKIPQHCYEVIPEGAACRLYFDIEFKREVNPTVDPIFVLDVFIQFVCYQLYVLHHVTCERSNILDLDSTTPQKFSRHLIFHMPSTVFRNNIVAGQFVRSICDKLRRFEHLVEGGMTIEEAHKQVFSSSKEKIGVSSCLSGDNLRQLFVKNEHGRKVLICDEAVYTRNRNFRLYRSSKLGKTTKLRVAAESKFLSSYSGGASKRKRWSNRFNTLMDSLICNVSFHSSEHMKILPCGLALPQTAQRSKTKLPIVSDHSVQSLPTDKVATSSSSSTALAKAESATGYSHSPFPSVDVFITSQLTKGGVQGSIRRWTYFPTGKLILYDIQHNRWCENIGRAHKSNNIMIIADLKKGTYYQKCHDPDCKRINFRSNEIPIPLECNPVLQQQMEEERKQIEEEYIGDVSLESIMDKELEETFSMEHVEEQEATGLHSANPRGTRWLSESSREDGQFKGTFLTDEHDCSTRVQTDPSQDYDFIDSILMEAIEDYEARLSAGILGTNSHMHDR